jgi:hypothetical protein
MGLPEMETEEGPVMVPGAVGSATTLTVAHALHPLGNIYEMIADKFAATPVTTPVPLTTLAIVGEPLCQVPPGVASPRVMVASLHTLPAPVTGASGLTVTTSVAVQPSGTE